MKAVGPTGIAIGVTLFINVILFIGTESFGQSGASDATETPVTLHYIGRLYSDGSPIEGERRLHVVLQTFDDDFEEEHAIHLKAGRFAIDIGSGDGIPASMMLDPRLTLSLGICLDPDCSEVDSLVYQQPVVGPPDWGASIARQEVQEARGASPTLKNRLDDLSGALDVLDSAWSPLLSEAYQSIEPAVLSFGSYLGFTPLSPYIQDPDGDFGIAWANTQCQSHYGVSAHMCTAVEILAHQHVPGSTLPPPQKGWVDSANLNCNGWTSSGSSGVTTGAGTFVENDGANHWVAVGPCNQRRKILCCGTPWL